MWRKQLTAIFGCLALSATAHAGALGKVVGGLHEAAGGGGGSSKHTSGSSGSGGSSSGSWSGGGSDHGGGHCCSDSWMTFGGYGSGYGYGYGPPSGGSVDVDAYVGLQSVTDSNGSLSAEIRATHANFGIGVHDTSFFEDPGPGAMQETTLDLWAIAGHVRLANDGPTQMWAEAGLAGVKASPDLSFFGAEAGLMVQHHLVAALGLTAGARYYVLEHDVRATEVQAGIHVSILRISYRIVDFNVGPPLRGPEIGVAVRF